jgi:hypothetical protein
VAGYPNFELVIYTSETLFTAPAIIEAIDQKHKIAYRLVIFLFDFECKK